MVEDLALLGWKLRDIQLPGEPNLWPRMTPLYERREHRARATVPDPLAEVLSLRWMELERALIGPALGRFGEARVPPRSPGDDCLAVVVERGPARPCDCSSPLLARSGHASDAPSRKALPIDHARNLTEVLSRPAADNPVRLASL